MARKFSELTAKLPKEVQENIKKRVEANVEEILMSEMRKLAGFTQEKLAEKMGITQSALSQLENQPDPHLSTLSKMVKALGGELEICVKYQGKDLKIKQTA
jgi:predicted transcriptional regulator